MSLIYKASQKTMYTADEVIDDLQENVGIFGEEVAHDGNTVTREYADYWEMGQGSARRTGYIKWRTVDELDNDGEYMQELDRTVLEFSEDDPA